MSQTRPDRSIRNLLLGLAALLIVVAPLAAAPPEQTASLTVDRLKVRNLVGEVRVEGHGGSAFEVVLRVGGRDAAEGLVRLDAADDRVNVVFPRDVREYVYPRLGRGGETSWRVEEGSWLSELFGELLGSGRIKVRGEGAGTELWADLTVRVPVGGELEVEHGVGGVTAQNVDGRLELSTRSGDVSVDDTRGRLAVATGSGTVTLARSRGEQLEIATGSGEVKIEDCDGDELQVATGSGSIGLVDVRGRSVQLATGSGEIAAQRLDVEEMDVGTGSGAVTLVVDRIGDGEYNVGTGSGDITLTLPGGVSVEVHAETRGGEIAVDLPGAQFRKQEQDEVRLSVGDGGARIDLGSGGGDIRIRG